MDSNRRRHERLSKRFEGHWRGASGATRSSIADLSLGGCFVESVAKPGVGEDTTVTIDLGDHVSVSFAGKVVYADGTMGFAVRFYDLKEADRTRLEDVIDSLSPRVAKV